MGNPNLDLSSDFTIEVTSPLSCAIFLFTLSCSVISLFPSDHDRLHSYSPFEMPTQLTTSSMSGRKIARIQSESAEGYACSSPKSRNLETLPHTIYICQATRVFASGKETRDQGEPGSHGGSNDWLQIRPQC
jgi:hypothetical protein